MLTNQRLLLSAVVVFAVPAAAQAQSDRPVRYHYCVYSQTTRPQIKFQTPGFASRIFGDAIRRQFTAAVPQAYAPWSYCKQFNTAAERDEDELKSLNVSRVDAERGMTVQRYNWQPADAAQVAAPLDQSDTELQTAWVQYLSIGRSMVGTGYNHARVPLRFRFINCGGEIHIAYGLEPKRIEVGPYVLNGKSIPSTNAPLPMLSSLEVAANVRWRLQPEVVHYFKDVNTGPALGYGCFTGQTQKIGTVAKLIGANAKPDAVKAYLEGLFLIDARVDPWRVLRNTAFETDKPRGEKVAEDNGGVRDAVDATDNVAVRDLNAGLARDAHARNAAFTKAREEYRAGLARQQAEVADVVARNAARAAEYARQKAEADAAQRAYEEALRARRR